MADILPFHGYRYHNAAGKIEDLILSNDSNSGKSPRINCGNAFNVGNVMKPAGAGTIIKEWISKKVIFNDALPGIYVLYQNFIHENTPRCRKGFICHMELRNWEDNIILRHENILPELLEFQSALLNETEMYFTPVHGLFQLEKSDLEEIMEETMLNPLVCFTDSSGVENRLGVVHDRKAIQKFIDHIKPLQVTLADGHHRYTAALSRMQNVGKNRNFICTYLTNYNDNDIVLLPLHCIVKWLDHFSEENFIKTLKLYFNVYEINEDQVTNVLGKANLFSLGLITKNSSYIFEPLELPENLVFFNKQSELTIAEELIFKRILGLNQYQETISYETDYKLCVEKVKKQGYAFAIIHPPTNVNEVVQLAEKNIMLPEKTTYFFPKIASGLLMSTARPHDSIMDLSCFNSL